MARWRGVLELRLHNADLGLDSEPTRSVPQRAVMANVHKLAKPTQSGIYELPRGFALKGPTCEGGFLRIGDLRLPVSTRAGPPIGLQIRSRELGTEAFADRMMATKPAGFEVGRWVVRRQYLTLRVLSARAFLSHTPLLSYCLPFPPRAFLSAFFKSS